MLHPLIIPIFFICSFAYSQTPIYNEDFKLIAKNSLPGDTVAFSIAADEQSIVLGAYRKNYPGNGPDSGAIYVFSQSDKGWTQLTELAATDGAGFDYLGWSVDIEEDVIAAGATWSNEPLFKSGGVYIFRNNTDWIEETIIAPSDLPEEANFGHSLDLDSERLIVGAPFIDKTVNAQGVVYIFADNDGKWEQEARLAPGDKHVNFVGASVAIDGNIAAIGAPRDNSDGVSAGSVFVYKRNDSGNWTFVNQLSPDSPEPYSYFGNKIAVEGSTVIVGSEYSDIAGPNTGAVFVFDLDEDTWVQSQILTPSDKLAWSHFGGSIDIRNGTLAVGAYGHPNSSGFAYIFERNKNGQFIETAHFAPSDGIAHDRFGNDVAVGGNFIAIGSPYHSDEQGAGYIYQSDSKPLRNQYSGRLSRQKNAGSFRNGLGFEYFGHFNGHDYFMSTELLEYYDAHEMANVLGAAINRPAALVAVNNIEESDYIQSISTEVLWIGLTDLETEGTFAWDNDEPLDWADWGKNEPNKNGGTEDVVAMNWEYSKGKILGWNDWKEQHRYARALIELDGKACNGDTDYDNDIDGDDIANIISTWGDLGGIGDVNNDGVINITDLLWLLDFWGPCP